jgi:NTP pyrophosphatase (non-canonical NTP hydrolase)
MAKYQIKLPTDVKELLDAEVRWAELAQGNVPAYPLFVNRLMKEMPSPADELHHACTGVAGEGGELLDLSKKVWAYGKPLDVKHMLEELGDLRFYYQALLNLLGVTDEQIKAHNMVKLNERYASGTYSDAQAIARADKAPGADRNFMGKPRDKLDPPVSLQLVGKEPKE